LGLGLVVVIMALLLTGTLKGLFSYRATMRTIDRKLAEVQELDKLQAAVKALNDPFANDLNCGDELRTRVDATRQALAKYNEKLTDNITSSRDPNTGWKEVEYVKAIERQIDKFVKAVFDAQAPGVYGPAANLAQKLTDRPTVKPVREKLEALGSELHSVIHGHL